MPNTRVCRDQWIRAKYERKEFTIEAIDSDKLYLSGQNAWNALIIIIIILNLGLKKGFLHKKKKIDNVWQNRFFVLDKDTLSYYKKLAVRYKIQYLLFYLKT